MRSLLSVTAAGCLLCVVSSWGLMGCASLPGAGGAEPASTQPAATTQPTKPPVTAEQRAKARAERIAEELERGEANSSKRKPIRWDQHPKPTKTPPATQPTTSPPKQTATTQPTKREPARLSFQQLIEQINARLASSDQTPEQKAIAAMGLSFASPDWQMNERLLAGLTDDQRDQIEKLQSITAVLAKQFQSGKTPLSREAIAAQLNQIFGQQPIAIHTLELCKRVTGFGVYEPFASHTFLAGTDHKMIVYVELRHFRPVQQTDGQYQVQLKQQVFLFNQSDGLEVWHHKPVQIIDTSRNRRHDFFVVQLIDLPANLSVGKYRLKVRVTDEQGGSLDEKTTDLQIVADKSLLSGDSNGGTAAGG